MGKSKSIKWETEVTFKTEEEQHATVEVEDEVFVFLFPSALDFTASLLTTTTGLSGAGFFEWETESIVLMFELSMFGFLVR